jgi:hypothetical protein
MNNRLFEIKFAHVGLKNVAYLKRHFHFLSYPTDKSMKLTNRIFAGLLDGEQGMVGGGN